MNPYTTMTRTRIQPRDMARALLADPFTGGASLAVLERQRSFQAEAEVAWLLKQHDVQPASAAASWLALVRRTIGTVLVRTGERLASVPRRGLRSETAPAAGSFGTAG